MLRRRSHGAPPFAFGALSSRLRDVRNHAVSVSEALARAGAPCLHQVLLPWGVDMKALLLGLAMLGAVAMAAPAFAQDDEVIVVTGSRIQSDDEYQQEFGWLPYISIKVPADFVVFTVDLESATKSIAEREKELESSFAKLAQRVAKTQGVTVEVGQPGQSSPVETMGAREGIEERGERSAIPVVLKFAIKPGENFPAVRKRAEAFIESIEVSGRVEATPGDNQYIGVNDPAKHREDLMRKIAADIKLLTDIFTPAGQPAPGMSLIGLATRVKSRPVGALELEMYVPYDVVLGAPLPQPPPPRRN